MSWPVFCYVDGIGLVNLQHVVRVEHGRYGVPTLHMANGDVLIADGETMDGDELDERINEAIFDTAKTVAKGTIEEATA